MATAASNTSGPHTGVVGIVQSHPKTTALAIAALTVVVVILLGSNAYYRGKSGFQGNLTPGNFTITGMNPLWQMGSENAGMWGSMDRAPTETNMAVYNPSFRMGARMRQSAGRMRASGGAPSSAFASAYKGGRGPRALASGQRETLEGPCGPGQKAVTLSGADGQPVTTCVNSPLDTDDAALGGVDANPDHFDERAQCTEWDPDATVEAQALASVGGLSGRTYAEDPLRRAIEFSTDDSAGLTAPALAKLARYSGAP
jgi:hypothetical protein